MSAPAPGRKWWGTDPSPELARLIEIIHNVLFHEDETSGPVFVWSDTRLSLDDDPLLGCVADQVAFELLDRSGEVLGLIRAITGDGLIVDLTLNSGVGLTDPPGTAPDAPQSQPEALAAPSRIDRGTT